MNGAATMKISSDNTNSSLSTVASLRHATA